MSSQSQSAAPTPLASNLIPQIPSWFYKAPERNQRGGFSNYIVRKQGDFERICFQATAQEGEPRCVAPFGVSKPYDQNKQDDSNKRNFELNIHSPQLMQFLQALDANTIKQAVANYENWFNSDDGKKKKKAALTPADIEGMYRRLVQEGDPENGYAPTFRTKVHIDGVNKVRVFVYEGMVNGQHVCREGDVMKDLYCVPFVECIPIIEIVGMWFMSKQYGLSLTTTDVVIFPKNKRPPGQFNFGGMKPTIVKEPLKSVDMDIVPSEEASSSSSSSNSGPTTFAHFTGGTPQDSSAQERKSSDAEEEDEEDGADPDSPQA